MKKKTANIIYWLSLIGIVIYIFYQVGTCPPNRCSLDLFKTILVILIMGISIFGIYRTKDKEPSIEDLIEMKDDENKEEKI